MAEPLSHQQIERHAEVTGAMPPEWRSLGGAANAVVDDLRRRLAERAAEQAQPEGDR